jgi:hypothetical protein
MFLWAREIRDLYKNVAYAYAYPVTKLYTLGKFEFQTTVKFQMYTQAFEDKITCTTKGIGISSFYREQDAVMIT